MTCLSNLSQDRNVSISTAFLLPRKSVDNSDSSVRHVFCEKKTSHSILPSSCSLVFCCSESIFGTVVIANSGYGDS